MPSPQAVSIEPQSAGGGVVRVDIEAALEMTSSLLDRMFKTILRADERGPLLADIKEGRASFAYWLDDDGAAIGVAIFALVDGIDTATISIFPHDVPIQCAAVWSDHAAFDLSRVGGVLEEFGERAEAFGLSIVTNTDGVGLSGFHRTAAGESWAIFERPLQSDSGRTLQ
jgi:hypothetical protein